LTLMDVNIAKLEIPIHIRKAFDQGRIDKVYEAMYILADRLAATDTRRCMDKKPLEFYDEKIQEIKSADSKKTSWPYRISKQIFSYRQRRFIYHLDYVYRVLELYVASKSKVNG